MNDGLLKCLGNLRCLTCKILQGKRALQKRKKYLETLTPEMFTE